jgi:putative transposase
MTSKKRRRHPPDQIIRKLAEGKKLLASGQELDAVYPHLEGRRVDLASLARPVTAG